MFTLKKKRLFLLATLALFAIGLSMIGCEGDEGPAGLAGTGAGSIASMYGWIQTGTDGGMYKGMEAGDPVTAIVRVNNIPGVPVVTVNNATLMIEPELTIYGGGLGFYGVTATDANDSVSVTASFTDTDGLAAAAYAHIKMVDTFDIVTPVSSDVDLALGDSLRVVWSAAEGAVEYWYVGYFEGRYTDTAGEYKEYEWRFSKTTSATAVTFSADSIFGDISDVDSLRDLWGDFDVYAVSGASLSGGSGNVTGDGMGVVLGMSYGGDLDIDDATGTGKVSEPVNGTQEQPEFAELFWQRIVELQN